MLNAEGVKKNIVDQLFWDDRVDASTVRVEVFEGGKARLTGSVPSFSARRSAETDAWLVEGITEVENLLTVETPLGMTIPSDEEITNAISNALYWNAGIDSSDIQINTQNGVVSFNGEVPSFWQKQRAEELASGIVGVSDVVNKLSVVPGEKYSDISLAEDVRAALERNYRINANAVDLSVKDGTVTLSGQVRDWRTFTEVEDTVRYTRGVKNVVNELRIKSERPVKV